MIDFNGTLVDADSYEDFKDGQTKLFGDVVAGLERLSNKYMVLVSKTPTDLLEKRAEALGIGKYFSRKVGSLKVDGADLKEMKKRLLKNSKDAPYDNVYFVGNDPDEINFFNGMGGLSSQRLYSIAVLRGQKKVDEYERKVAALGTTTAKPNYTITSLRKLADIIG